MKSNIDLLEKQMEDALKIFEQHHKYNEALEGYQLVEKELTLLLNSSINLDLVDRNYLYKVLSQCYLRQAGMYRQLDKIEEAEECNKKEQEFAKLSDDTISLAQSIFSNGINLISKRVLEEGLNSLEEAKKIFESGNTDDHKQGVGWYWLILADIGNKGIIEYRLDEIVNFADNAITILTPIRNWAGVSRAYQARSIAYEKKGDLHLAKLDLEESNKYKEMMHNSDD